MALSPIVAAVAGLAAVDGAVLFTDRYELLGLGAKIGRRKGRPQVEQAAVTEPIKGGQAGIVHPEQLGGTRHLPAAQFTQDGHFTVFEWSECESMVHAHKLDVLLL